MRFAPVSHCRLYDTFSIIIRAHPQIRRARSQQIWSSENIHKLDQARSKHIEHTQNIPRARGKLMTFFIITRKKTGTPYLQQRHK